MPLFPSIERACPAFSGPCVQSVYRGNREKVEGFPEDIGLNLCQDRRQNCRSRLVQYPFPQLAWTQPPLSLECWDVESPRPGLTRETLEESRRF